MHASPSDASPDGARRRHRFGLGFAVLSGPLAAVLLLACYLWTSDRTLLGEIVTIWPPVGWGFLLLVRAAVLRVRGRSRVALATLLATSAFLIATTEWRPLLRTWRCGANPAASAGAEALPLRVVVWNVAGAAPLAELDGLSPDLCFLQEIGSLSAAVQRTAAWRDHHVLEGFDPGIVSRYPMRRLPAGRVGPWTEPLVALVDLPGGRRVVVVDARLTLPGIAISMASPSEWRNLPVSHRERLAQFPRLAALIERTMREEHAVAGILAGDFNTPGGMASLAPLRSVVRDVWPLAGVGWGATMTAEMPLSRIDQCWISEGIVPVAAHVERRGASDHRLLVVDLFLPASLSGT
jgi:endonuclease/exonuclease/phosphatase (EEP) superfamily protein YafD